MLDHYWASADTVVFTGGADAARPRNFVPAMQNPRLAHDELEGAWHGVEVTATGDVSTYD